MAAPAESSSEAEIARTIRFFLRARATPASHISSPGPATAGAPAAQSRTRRRRRIRRILLLLVVLGLGAAGVDRFRTREEPPWTDPVVIDGGRCIKEFALKDTRGLLHTAGEWQESKGLVLFFLGTECPVSNGYAPEMERLARTYRSQGLLFYGVHADPDVTAEIAASHAADYHLTFPVLLDPGQNVAAQAGVRVTPEAVVLAPGGEVLYHGRIDDRYTTEGRRRPQGVTHDLETAIRAVVADEMPVVTETRAFGCPLPPGPAASAPARPTYAKDVAPIFWKNCAVCHRPGGVAPFPLLTYRDAAKRAQFLSEVTVAGRMPPWKPHPGYGIFLDSLRLTDREIQLLANWANTGAAEGDPADLPPRPQFTEGWQLGKPDLVVTMPEPYRVLASSTDDVYRVFVIPLPLGRDQPISTVEFRPGNRKVVHHARMFVDASDGSRQRDRQEPGPGFYSFGGGDIGLPTLGEWTPGTLPRLPPRGVGKTIQARSDLVLLIHYHPDGKPEVDRSSVGLYFRTTPPTRLFTSVPLSDRKIDIPPGVKHHKITLTAIIPADAHLYSVSPHGHYLLREMKVTATLPDGSAVPLIWIEDWDINWQGLYQYAKPVKLPKGTRVHLVADYDNSADNVRNPNRPPKRVRLGPNSTDEMLNCFLRVIPDDPADYEVFATRWPNNL